MSGVANPASDVIIVMGDDPDGSGGGYHRPQRRRVRTTKALEMEKQNGDMEWQEEGETSEGALEQNRARSQSLEPFEQRNTPYPSEYTQQIDWSDDLVTLFGYANRDTYDIVVSVSIAGIKLGNISRRLKYGVKLEVDRNAFTGSLTLYLRDGDGVWTAKLFKDALQQQGDAT